LDVIGIRDGALGVRLNLFGSGDIRKHVKVGVKDIGLYGLE
jgi:hypothetical protein